MTTLYDIGTGIQFFWFGYMDLEAAQLRQIEVELMLSGLANDTLADARKALDVKKTVTSFWLIEPKCTKAIYLGLDCDTWQ